MEVCEDVILPEVNPFLLFITLEWQRGIWLDLDAQHFGLHLVRLTDNSFPSQTALACCADGLRPTQRQPERILLRSPTRLCPH